jgi:glycosyltransferase involved in cell wall biosynthesis
MRILFVVHNLGKDVPESKSSALSGGCETFTYSLAHALSAEHVCYILYPDLKNKGVSYLHKIENFRNYTLKEYAYVSKFQHLREFERILSDENIDLIHYQHLIHSPIEYPLIGKAKRIPQILSLHDYYFICEEHFLENDKYTHCDVPQNIHKCVECLKFKSDTTPNIVKQRRVIMRELLEVMDKILAPSKSVQFDYFKIYGEEIGNKIEIVPIGVKMPVGVTKRERGEGDLIHVGVVNYLTYIKGWSPLVSVIRMCHSKLPNVRFKVTAPLDPHQMEFLKGWSNVDLGGRMYDDVDVVWIPSIAKESFSLVASEAMMLGIPIMCRKTGALECSSIQMMGTVSKSLRCWHVSVAIPRS